MSLWVAVLGSAFTLVWSGSALGLVHKLNIVIFVLLVGVWATLQFRSIYRDNPDFARLLERCAVRVRASCVHCGTVARFAEWNGGAFLR